MPLPLSICAFLVCFLKGETISATGFEYNLPGIILLKGLLDEPTKIFLLNKKGMY